MPRATTDHADGVERYTVASEEKLGRHVVTLDFNYDGGMGKVGQASRSRTGNVISCLDPVNLL
jgi:hypothetical protein